MLGEPILFGRDHEGEIYAYRDICPHRGVPLTGGRVYKSDCGTEVECPYHGWRFGTDGRCTSIPSLVQDQQVDLQKIRIFSYPTCEQQGLVWIFIPNMDPRQPLLDEQKPAPFKPVLLPDVGDRKPKLILTAKFSCHIDNAMIGLMDPAHGPFVHQSWFWRTQKTMHEKAKRFGPVDLGFSMPKHSPSSNSFAYKILGGKPTTEISVRLPGIRLEHIRVGERFVMGMTAISPVDDMNTDITQIFWSDHPVFTVAKPFLRIFGQQFLNQDRDAVNLQYDGLKYNPRLMLVGDPDQQARWYFRMKKAWFKADGDPDKFENPVQDEVTLRWRS